MTSARHLQSAAQRGAGPTQELLERRGQLPAWDGTMPQSYSEIMMRHATCNSIDLRLHNLDFFCILMELHAYCTIKVTCIAKHITVCLSHSMCCLYDCIYDCMYDDVSRVFVSLL